MYQSINRNARTAVALTILVALMLASSSIAYAKVFPYYQPKGLPWAQPGQTILVSTPMPSNPVRIGSPDFGDPCSRSTTQLIKYKCQLNALREDPDPARTILKALSFQGDELKTTKSWVERIGTKGATTADELAKPGVLEAYTQVLGNLDGMKNYNLQDLQNALVRRYPLNLANGWVDMRAGNGIKLSNDQLWSGGAFLDLKTLNKARITALPLGGFTLDGKKQSNSITGRLTNLQDKKEQKNIKSK
ncbi:MAG: hypothetical protein AABX47_04140 [Nanoarchaeota archaeon]